MIPGRLYPKVRIQGDDGFTMAKFIYVHEQEHYDKLMEKLKVENPTSRLWDEAYIKKMFTKYLKGFCADGFCVGAVSLHPTEADNWQQKSAFYIGFRSKKDLFKFNMRFSAIRVRWWNSATHFTVVGTADDPYVPVKAGESWNKEDPQGFIKP